MWELVSMFSAAKKHTIERIRTTPLRINPFPHLFIEEMPAEDKGVFAIAIPAPTVERAYQFFTYD